MPYRDEQLQSRYPAPRTQTGHAYGLLGDVEVLVDTNTNEVFASAPGLGIGRKLGKVSEGRFYVTGSAMGDAAVRNLDAQAINYDFPNPAPSAAPSAAPASSRTPVTSKTPTPNPAPSAAPPAAPPSSPTKPKFNLARAEKFSGEDGYEYAIDPETNVIAILKSPRRTSASPVYVRPDGKFPDAYTAIMAEYRASQVPTAPTRRETTPIITTRPPAPITPPSDAAPVKERRRSLISWVSNSSANNIESDDF